ncbi:MAG: pseudouridine synthase [Myxococcota bacterium]
MARLGVSSEGRVFVNGRPADTDEPVDRGDRIEVFPLRKAALQHEVFVLAQRDGIILAHKPAGLPTETTQHGQESAVSALLARLNGGRVHAASRLDTQVSGVVAFTLGRDAARRMEQWRERSLVRRDYLALASVEHLSPVGEWTGALVKVRDRGGRFRSVVRGDGKPAHTRYRVAGKTPVGVGLLVLTPTTGRLHQLRAHAAAADAPLLGDRTYGGERRLVDGNGRILELERVALHAFRVELPHQAAESEPPALFEKIWRTSGGDDWPALIRSL